jgi:type IV secretion system protein VirD4
MLVEQPASSSPEDDTIISSKNYELYNRYIERKKVAKAEANAEIAKKKRKERKEKQCFNESTFLSICDGYSLSQIASPLHPSSVTYRDKLHENDFVPEYMEMNLHEDSSFFFGSKPYLGNGNFVGKPQKYDGHIMVVGGPGSCKTAGIVIPTMKTWKGIQVIVDVKGGLENHWRALNRDSGKRLKVFDPINKHFCGFDPFAFLRLDKTQIVNNIRELALLLLPMPPGTREPVWTTSSQNFLTGTLLYFFEIGASFIDAMTEIQLKSVDKLCQEVMESDNNLAKMFMSKLQNVKPEILAGVGMDLTKLIVFTTDQFVMNALSPENKADMIDWGHLNLPGEIYDVILSIPEDKIEQWESVTMLLISQLVKSLERRADKHSSDGKKLLPILIMLDEFDRIGTLPSIKSALATLRSRGVTVALFVQSIAQLDERYGVFARKIISDTCSFKVLLNVMDADTQKYFSDLVGTSVIVKRGNSVNHDTQTGEIIGLCTSFSEVREAIMEPHEFLTLDDIILLCPNGVFRLYKVNFFDNKHIFLPNNFKAEPLTYRYNF